MRLHELTPAAGDREEQARRYVEDGCLLVRGAIDRDLVAAVGAQVAAVLRRWEIARPGAGPEIRWTGRSPDLLDPDELHAVPALRDTDATLRAEVASLLDQVCPAPMHVWRGGFLHLTLPDDPAYAGVPHQDGYSMTTTGDYRRAWIPITPVAFGDAGLAFAVGSHRRGRLPYRPFPDARRRPATGRPQVDDSPVHGIGPELVGDTWHTAALAPGDAFVFSSETVHLGLPATSDRIRVAVAVASSGMDDPRPRATFTAHEHTQRMRRIREHGARLGIAETEFMRIRADLLMTGIPVTEETVRAAAAGEHAGWRENAPLSQPPTRPASSDRNASN
ncbi:phytanoyl-CoA dioxygenase family protein [Pseudonocardia sp. GCM10023141]|uniref:phytanoyl-CoA dioxygenase family protein n=1 Tax=Pseudonocardia sp. GCM10023141 TaxID=3252653 RepID=UPI00360BB6EE